MYTYSTRAQDTHPSTPVHRPPPHARPHHVHTPYAPLPRNKADLCCATLQVAGGDLIRFSTTQKFGEE